MHRHILKQEPTTTSLGRETTKEEEFPRWVKPGRSFSVLTCLAQLIFLWIFFKGSAKTSLEGSFSSYMGVSFMSLVGFGYLRALLKAYGLAAIGFTILIVSLGLQWAMILECFAHQADLVVELRSLLDANFAVVAVLVSFGALIGRISPTQILMLVLLETPAYVVNKAFILHQAKRHTRDGGGTIFVHVFGSYFGITCGLVLGPAVKDRLRCSSYQSDIFSLIGTVFLWMFWPSFVAAGHSPQEQSKALVNTVLALICSTVTTFGCSQILQDGKLSTLAVQNATLAGGVAVGATAGIVGPFGAASLGMTAGALSTVAFSRLTLFQGVDTCGVHNLHGLPGLLGGIFSLLVPGFYDDTGIVPWDQLLALISTLLLAVASGGLCGLILKVTEWLHDDRDLRRAAAEVGLDPSDLQVEPYSDHAFWTSGDGHPDVPVIEL